MSRQVIDTGLDESSCYFANDETGDQVEHGYYFDEFGVTIDPSYLFYSSSSPYSDDNIFATYDDDFFATNYDDTAAPGGGSSSTGPARVADHSGSYYSSQSYYSYQTERRFSGGDFTVYPERRKVRSRRVGCTDRLCTSKRRRCILCFSAVKCTMVWLLA